jgi:endonuclease YncB( thermonuclease family)
MKPPRAIVVLTTVVVAATAGAETTWRCREVIDGDTIVAESDAGQIVQVNLYGVDAPEIAQPSGDEAKAFLEELALGRVITVSGTNTSDKQVTASVQVEGTDLSQALVSSGLAWLPEDGGSSEAIAIALFTARSEGTGLWGDSNAEHPLLWRQRHRPPPPSPTPEQRLSDIAAQIDLAGENGQAVVISDIPSAFTRDRETRLLVENMAVIAEAAEGLANMEAAYRRHCSPGRGSSSSTGGSVWSEELNQWVDGTNSTREEACRAVNLDISRVRGAIKQARDKTADDARRFGVQDHLIRDIVDYFDLKRF